MRYRHVWPGFLLLGSLAVSLVALLAGVEERDRARFGVTAEVVQIP